MKRPCSKSSTLLFEPGNNQRVPPSDAPRSRTARRAEPPCTVTGELVQLVLLRLQVPVVHHDHQHKEAAQRRGADERITAPRPVVDSGLALGLQTEPTWRLWIGIGCPDERPARKVVGGRLEVLPCGPEQSRHDDFRLRFRADLHAPQPALGVAHVVARASAGDVAGHESVLRMRIRRGFDSSGPQNRSRPASGSVHSSDIWGAGTASTTVDRARNASRHHTE